MSLKSLTQARWFPTVSKPVISGLLASGVVFGLHAVGITHFTSNEMNAAITPLAGFLVTMIVDKEKGDPAPAAQPDFIHTIVPILVPDVEQLLKDNPDLLRTLLDDAIAAGQKQADVVVAKKAVIAPADPAPPDSPGFIR